MFSPSSFCFSTFYLDLFLLILTVQSVSYPSEVWCAGSGRVVAEIYRPGMYVRVCTVRYLGTYLSMYVCTWGGY